MKKLLISQTIIILMLLSVIAVPTFANAEDGNTQSIQKIIVGDADGDGEISIKDATQIQRYLANLDCEENIGKEFYINKSEQVTTEPATTQSSTEPTGNKYSPGAYLVGTDLPAGEYVLQESLDAYVSYFSINKKNTIGSDTLIMDKVFSNRIIVTLNDGVSIDFSGCTLYPYKDAPKVDTSKGFLQEGMYKVGDDFPAGTYKLQQTWSFGAYTRQDKSYCNDPNVIANEIFYDEVYITVYNGEYLILDGAELIL